MLDHKQGENPEQNTVEENKDQAMTAAAGKEAEKTSFKSELFEWIRMFVFAAVVVFLLQNFVIVNATIPTGSMENTISVGDRVIASRLSYYMGDPKRGDIIIFKYPIDKALGHDLLYIKRVIGLPGDHVEIHDSKVTVNGQTLEETYLKEEWIVSNDGYEFDVPKDHYLCMGDNRNNSLDGRFWDEEALKYGLASTFEEAESFRYVPREDILGKAMFRYWPFNAISMVK